MQPSSSKATHLTAKEIAERVIAENRARQGLSRSLAGLGLPVEPNLDVPAALTSIKVRCRRDNPSRDEATIYSVLDELGWRADPVQWSFFRNVRDVVRLLHEASGARLVMIVCRPWAEVPCHEPA